MRILHIITSLKIGGAETLLVQLLPTHRAEQINTLSRNQSQHIVIFFHDGPNRMLLEQNGILCYQIRGLFCLYDPIFIIRLLYKIYTIKPRLIHTWLWSANFLGTCCGTLLRIPVIVSIHAVYNKTAQAKNSLLKTLLDRFTFYYASSIVFVAASTKRLVMQHQKINEQKAVVIPNGVPLPKESTIAHHKKKPVFIIGTVGRFIPLKNHDLLIDVFYELWKKNSAIQLLLIGYGPQEQALKDQVQTLALSSCVTFIKTQKPQDYYPFMDCFILPSDQEGMSVALLEAMSYGIVPIVTSRDKQHDIIINNHNGIISNFSRSEIIQALLKVQDATIRSTLSKNAYKTIYESYTIEKMQQRYAQLYKEY